MKSKIISLLLACVGAGLADAQTQFNPVPLTPDSYTYAIVVPAGTVLALPYCVNVTAGAGVSLGDTTYFEQGLYNRPGQSGANIGIPPHNTLLTNINNANMTFLMPPTYTTNNDVMIDNDFTSGTLNFNTPTTATNLAILCCGGGGAITINYTVTHADSSTETGTLSLLDWFNGGSTVAWGANGRVSDGGGYENINTSAANNNPPYLYANTITVSSAQPVTSISFSYSTGGSHANIFAVSGNASGATWAPIPVGGFNCEAIVPAAVPFPVNATMDQGTNIIYAGNGLNTWFESGYIPNLGVGLPPSGTSFNSQSQSTHTYQMGDYSTNCATLIDTNHQAANIVPATPAAYSAFALLTAGGNIGGGNTMTNICVLQHQDGVNETNLFYAYDWFDQNHNGAIAFESSGRVDMSARAANNVGNSFPFLFETYFTLTDASSPVTNILVLYKTAPNVSATTFIMAVSAASGGIAPVVNSGPIPGTATILLGQTTNFTVGVSGTAPIGGYWEVENGGSYYQLSDGLDANGSTISGSATMTLTISNAYLADATNYQFIATNAFGSGNSTPATLIVKSQPVAISPATPVFYTSNNITLTASVGAGPAVTYQWFYIDNSSNSNAIPGATNSAYTIVGAPLSFSGYTYGVIAANGYGTNVGSVVLNISDSAAFLTADLSPLSAEAYAGAPVLYTVGAAGNSPISYEWLVNGSVVAGATNASYTLAAGCGNTTVQAAFSNALSGAIWVMTSQATLQGDPNPTNITFNVNGTGWKTNSAGGGNVPQLTNNVLVLTDGGSGEAATAFYEVPQYIGGSWTASFIYNSHGGAADGTAFILQTIGPSALGNAGSGIGYAGITNSLAFEINLYDLNSETPGIAFATNGDTLIYQPAGSVSTTTTNPISVTLSCNNGVFTATLTDPVTSQSYTTNYQFGSFASILANAGDFAYIGFSGGDGGATSFQTVSDFQFQSVLPPVSLTATPETGGTVILAWPAADSTYQLQTTSSLTSPSWTAGPSPTVVGGNNQVTVNTSSGQNFYRLVRVVCD